MNERTKEKKEERTIEKKREKKTRRTDGEEISGSRQKDIRLRMEGEKKNCKREEEKKRREER